MVGQPEAPQKLDGGKGVRVTAEPKRLAFTFRHLSLVSPLSDDPNRGVRRYPETGFETISLQMNDLTDRGLGSRQYGTSEEIETLQGQNNPSAARLGTVECSSSFARSGQFARIIRACHRRVHRVVLF